MNEKTQILKKILKHSFALDSGSARGHEFPPVVQNPSLNPIRIQI